MPMHNTLISLLLMVDQHCDNDTGEVDSMAISANAYAMRELARLGHLKIKSDVGRRVIAEWTQPVDELLAHLGL